MQSVWKFDLLIDYAVEEWCESFRAIPYWVVKLQLTKSQRIRCVWKPCFVKFGHMCTLTAIRAKFAYKQAKAAQSLQHTHLCSHRHAYALYICNNIYCHVLTLVAIYLRQLHGSCNLLTATLYIKCAFSFHSCRTVVYKCIQNLKK